MTFQRSETVTDVPVNEELCIYETDGVTYNNAFKALLKDFYLIF
jgi:hypothetical protein